ncbi:Acyltransferase family domain containing protein [Rhypophila decipiens]
MSRFLSSWRRSGSSAAYALLGGITSQPNDSYPSTPSSSSTSTFEVDEEWDLGEITTEKHHPRTSLSFRLRHLLTPHGLTSLVLFLVSTIINYVPLLLPSYITALYHRFITSRHAKPAPSTPKKQSKTAYLDGLRGVAALIVYIFHFNYLFWPILKNGYGSSPSDTYIFQLPVLRVLHSGRSSVTIFFIISGFVLTLKTVTAIHRSANPSHDVLDGLAGSLFRRPFRLYLPILMSTAITAILSQASSNVFIPNLQGGDIPPRKGSWGEQFWHWLSVTERMVNPFQAVTGRQNLWGNDYNGHLWTIPTEFKGSVMVFVLMLAFCRSKRLVHFVGVLGAGYWQMVKGDFDQTLFCVGLVLAELSIILPTDLKMVNRGLKHGITVGLAILGCHLMSYPEARGPSSPGFRTLSGMVPTFYKGNEDRIQQFWISVGSILFVLALMYSPVVSGQWWKRGVQGTDIGEDDQGEPLLQKLFTNGFSQYLGQISYSLYLWHGMVNHLIGLRYLHPMSQEWNASETGINSLVSEGFTDQAAAARSAALSTYTWKWAWTFLFNTFVLFWVSDVFHRAVDVYAVRLTRKLSTWALASN